MALEGPRALGPSALRLRELIKQHFLLESTQLEEFLNAKVGQTTKVWEVIFNNLISGSRSWAETQIFHTNSARRTCWNLSRSLLDCYVLRSLVSEIHKNIHYLWL